MTRTEESRIQPCELRSMQVVDHRLKECEKPQSQGTSQQPLSKSAALSELLVGFVEDDSRL